MKKFLLLFLLLLLTPPNIISANVQVADTEESENRNNSGIFNSLYSNKYGELNTTDSHYILDIAPLDKEQMEAEENKSWWQRGWSYVNGSALKSEILSQIYEVINLANNFFFQLNIGMTQFMLSALNLAYEFDLIDQLIERVENVMQEISGISDNTFGSSGLFGSFAGIIAALAAIYACYLYVWKRAAVEYISELMKTVLAFSIALLFFSNYSAFLSGVNQVTTEASQLVLAGSINSNNSDENESNQGVDLREGMMNNIWTLFVDRPYLFMQYGSDNVDEVGEERIKELLKQAPGEGRQDYVIDKEIRGQGNAMMTYGSVMERAVFTPLYLFVNLISSIPIFLLALLLLVFQFWFIGIAAVAPFALLFAAIPGQFGVLKKYFVELGLPLVLKIVVSFGALVVFAISEIIYTLNDISAGGASEYVMICVLQFILLALMFFLRKRIKNIFSAGSKEVQALRAEVGSLKDAVTSPIKTGVQGTATVAGAVVGGVVAGGAGAAAGANIGSQAGRIATGDGSIHSVTSGIQQVQKLAYLNEKHHEQKTETDSPPNETNRLSDSVHDSTPADVQQEQSGSGNSPPQPGQEETDGAYAEFPASVEEEAFSSAEPLNARKQTQDERATDGYADLSSLEDHQPAGTEAEESTNGFEDPHIPSSPASGPVNKEGRTYHDGQTGTHTDLASLQDHQPPDMNMNMTAEAPADIWAVEQSSASPSGNRGITSFDHLNLEASEDQKIDFLNVPEGKSDLPPQEDNQVDYQELHTLKDDQKRDE